MDKYYFFPFLAEKEEDYDYNEENKKSGWKYWDVEPATHNPKPDITAQFTEKPRIYPKLHNDLENEVSDANPWWERIISNRH